MSRFSAYQRRWMLITAFVVMIILLAYGYTWIRSNRGTEPEPDTLPEEMAVLQQEIEELKQRLSNAESELQSATTQLDEALAVIHQMEQAEDTQDNEDAATEPEPQAAAEPVSSAPVSAPAASTSSGGTPPAQSSPPSSVSSSTAGGGTGSSGQGYGPSIVHDEDTNTTTVTFGSNGGTMDADPSPDHAAILAYAQSCAAELGLVWAGRTLDGFDFAVTLNGRSLTEVQEHIRSQFDNYKSLGVVNVYATITTDGYDYLTLYRG